MALGQSEAGRYLTVIFIHKMNNDALILSARDMKPKERNNMAGNKAKHLPSFKSVDELVGFFDTHDMGDYWEQMREADLEVKLKKKASAQINAKYISNTGKPWTSTQVKQLRQLASQDTPTRVIGLKLGRTESAVRTKASKKGVSLKPKTQSRSHRRKK